MRSGDYDKTYGEKAEDMIDRERDEIQALLRAAFPPVEIEPRRDLWPAMAQKIESRHAEGVWFDWAVAGVAGSLLAVFPELILVVVYHL